MLLGEFLESSKICKVCGNADHKNISVRTVWDDKEYRSAELTDNFLIFKFGINVDGQSDECYELFKFKLDDYKAEREIYNPNNFAMMFCNNFIFKIACKCEMYSIESSLITYHSMGSLTSNIYMDSEEIFVSDHMGWYRLQNKIHSDNIVLKYGGQTEGKIEFPFMTLKDFPIRNKSKMLKKIRMLMLLS